MRLERTPGILPSVVSEARRTAHPPPVSRDQSCDGTQGGAHPVTVAVGAVGGDGAPGATLLPAVGSSPSRSPSRRTTHHPGPQHLGLLAARHTQPLQAAALGSGDAGSTSGRFQNVSAACGGSACGGAGAGPSSSADGLPGHTIATTWEVAGGSTTPNTVNSQIASPAHRPLCPAAAIGGAADVPSAATGCAPGDMSMPLPLPPPAITPLGTRSRRGVAPSITVAAPNGRPIAARRSTSPNPADASRTSRVGSTIPSAPSLSHSTSMVAPYCRTSAALLEAPGSPGATMQPRPPLQLPAAVPPLLEDPWPPGPHASGSMSPRVMRTQLVHAGPPSHPPAARTASCGRQTNHNLEGSLERLCHPEKRLDEQLPAAVPVGAMDTEGPPPAVVGGGGGDAKQMSLLSEVAAAVGDLQRRVAEMSPRLPSDAGSGYSWSLSTRSSAPGAVNGESLSLSGAPGVGGPWGPSVRGAVSYSGVSYSGASVASVSERTADERLSVLELQMKQLTTAVCEIATSASAGAAAAALAVAPPLTPPAGSVTVSAASASGDSAGCDSERPPPSPPPSLLLSEPCETAECHTSHNATHADAASAAFATAMGVALGLVAAAALRHHGNGSGSAAAIRSTGASQRPKPSKLVLPAGLLCEAAVEMAPAAAPPSAALDSGIQAPSGASPANAATATSPAAAAAAMERLRAVEDQVRNLEDLLEELMSNIPKKATATATTTTITVPTVKSDGDAAAAAATATTSWVEAVVKDHSQQQQQQQQHKVPPAVQVNTLELGLLDSRVRDCEESLRQVQQQLLQQLQHLQPLQLQQEVRSCAEKGRAEASGQAAAAQENVAGIDGVTAPRTADIGSAATVDVGLLGEEENSLLEQISISEQQATAAAAAAAAAVHERWEERVDATAALWLPEVECTPTAVAEAASEASAEVWCSSNVSVGDDDNPAPLPAVSQQVDMPAAEAEAEAITATKMAEWQQRLLALTRQVQDMALEVTSARAQASSCAVEIQVVLEQVRTAQATAAAAVVSARKASTAAAAAERAAAAALDVVDMAATNARVTPRGGGGDLSRHSRPSGRGCSAAAAAAAAERVGGLQSPMRSEIWPAKPPRFSSRVAADAAAASEAAPAVIVTELRQRQRHQCRHQEREEEEEVAEDFEEEKDEEEQQEEPESHYTDVSPALLLPSRHRLAVRDVGFRIQPDGEDVVIGIDGGGTAAATLYGVSASRVSVLEAALTRISEVEESLQGLMSKVDKALKMRVTRDELRESVAQLDFRIRTAVRDAAANGSGGGGDGGGSSFALSKDATRVMSLGLRSSFSAGVRLSSDAGNGYGSGADLWASSGGGATAAAVGWRNVPQGAPIGLMAPGHRVNAWTHHGRHVVGAGGCGGGAGGVSDSVSSCGGSDGSAAAAAAWNAELHAALLQLQRAVGVVEQRLEVVETGVVQCGAAQAVLATSVQQLQLQPPQDRAITAPPQPNNRNGSVAEPYGNSGGDEQLLPVPYRMESAEQVQAELGRQVRDLVEQAAVAAAVAAVEVAASGSQGPQGHVSRGRDVVRNGALDGAAGRQDK